MVAPASRAESYALIAERHSINSVLVEDECLSRKMRLNKGGTRMIWRNVMEAALLGALRDVTSVSFLTFFMLDHDGILMLSVQSKTESSNWTTWDVDFLPRIATMAVVGEAMVPPIRCIW